MSKHKRKVRMESGDSVEGTVVNIVESTERFTDIKLEDGTILKAKVVVVEAVRVDDQWDNDGNPAYVLKNQTIVAVAETPDNLKREIQ